MSELICKKKKFEIEQQINEQTFIVKLRKKKFYFYQFNDENSFNEYLEKYNFLKNTGVKILKIKRLDKKALNVVVDYITGENPLIMLTKGELEDNVYEQIFLMSWYGKTDHVLLDFKPDNFIYSNGVLFYKTLDYYPYDEKKAFQIEGIFLWVYSKKLVEYLESKGLPVDMSRVKDEYLTNKEVVLKTVRYYH
ncbi:MAG: hypothetical protein ACI31G_00485 [Bacilli bacterium]